MTKVEVKIAVMEAEIALHRLKVITDTAFNETNYKEISEGWREYCSGFSRIQAALRDVGLL